MVAPRRHLQIGCVRRQCLQHQIGSRKNHAAAEDAVAVERIDGNGSAGGDHYAWRGKELFDHALTGGDHRRPAIRAELRRQRVAVGDAGRVLGSDQPVRHGPPAQQLRLDANARGLPRDVDADHPRRPRQVLPFAQGQRADILVAHGSLRDPAVLAREPPGQPAVTGIEEQ